MSTDGQGAADREPGDGHHERQSGGDHGAEHEQQDDRRGGEADALGADLARLGLRDALPAERDLEAGP